jgi:hypothetical protein
MAHKTSKRTHTPMGYRRKQVDPEFLGRGRILKRAQQYVTCNHSLFSVLLLSPA